MTDDEDDRPPSDVPAHELPALEWDGLTKRSSSSEWLLAKRDRLADAARDARWQEVLDVLREQPDIVNFSRLGGRSGFTPLHQAAHAGAPMRVVEELLQLGASRTLRNAKGERAVEIAERTGHAALRDVLTPRVVSAIGSNDIAQLEAQFHAVIQGRVAEEVLAHQLRLPKLEPLTEFPLGRRFWFLVPGMYGGFLFWLENAGDAPCLVVESWCRVVDGSGQRHRVRPGGYELEAEGFV